MFPALCRMREFLRPAFHQWLKSADFIPMRARRKYSMGYLTNKDYTVTKHDGHLRTRTKCKRKNTSRRVF